MQAFAGALSSGWINWILNVVLIVFFAYFYTSMVFNPDETADNMKQYGGFIPGIRAGNATSRYLTYVMNRLNTVGAVYLLFVALIPTVLIMALGLNAKLPFGGTTILIIAGVGPRHPAPGQGPDRTVPVRWIPVRGH